MENEDIKKRLNEYKGDGVEEVQVGQYYERKSGKQVVKVTKVESRWMITVETVMSKGKLITEDDDEYHAGILHVHLLRHGLRTQSVYFHQYRAGHGPAEIYPRGRSRIESQEGCAEEAAFLHRRSGQEAPVCEGNEAGE